MNRPRLLDLCCRGGGASAGYHAAGFDVTGVDVEPQPYYPFPFIQADALTVDLSSYDVIAASPPCQRYSTATPAARRDDHADLVQPIRERLQDAVEHGDAWAYVIENVPGSPLDNPITICGETLRLGVRRHRLFESNVELYGTPCHHDLGAPVTRVYGSRFSLGRKGLDPETSPEAGCEASRSPLTDIARTAMGIDWLPWSDLTQAIPPAYTTWIGQQLISRHGVTQVSRTQPSRPAAPRQPTDLTCRCGTTLTRPATGRWPRYCSHACRQAAYRNRTKGSAA